MVAGGDDDTDTADGPPADVTVDDLEGALLTLDDVGDDYGLDDEEEDDDDEDLLDSDSVDTSDECRAALERFDASDEGAQEVAVDFVNDLEGTIQHDISLLEDGQPTVADVRGAMDDCRIMGYDEETAGTIRFETSDVDWRIGDEAFGLLIDVEIRDDEGTGIGIVLEMYGVMFERDGVMSTVAVFSGFDTEGLDGPPSEGDVIEGLPPDRDQVEALAVVADVRLAEVLAG